MTDQRGSSTHPNSQLAPEKLATPKTDAQLVCISDSDGMPLWGEELVRAEFARHQERTIADLVNALTDLGDWLSYGLAKADGAEPTDEDLAACERVSANARAALHRAKA